VGRAWFERVEVATGDVHAPESLVAAMAGTDVAYYLIHGMSDSPDFHERDLAAARAFGVAARSAGVRRIVYLGGLGDPATDLSEHLRSRHATGGALGEAGVPVTEFRSAVIVGSGSVSFEMVRNLTERLPVMICPRWVVTRIQPIGIRDVLEYLVAAPLVPESAGRVVEIGGADVLTYRDMMLGYARVRGLRRWLIPVPVLTPRLSSYWVHWTTPVPAAIVRPLIEGMRNEVVVRDDSARRLFPGIRPMSYEDALRRALRRVEEGLVESRWSDALQTSQGDRRPAAFRFHEGMYFERRTVDTAAPPEAVFAVFTGLGGRRGWLVADVLWRIRGAMDRLVGGVGLRRGRRDPDHVRVGDAVDFWRVEAVEPGRLLRLRAEMKVPGRAWLEFEAKPRDGGGTELVQTAFFSPRGLTGILYWYSLYPVHGAMFSRMVRRIAARAESRVGAG
jgi:uncharacterized protein YbjT (DUF2867 family)/uncharacterized protein YndB with AHSA1/START domain